MHTILLPTDFSDNSLNAIQYALKFHTNKPTRFILLHVIEESASSVRVMINIEDKIKQNAMDDLKKFKSKVESIMEQHDIHSCETRIISGLLVQSVNNVYKSEKASAIFMGTQGANGLQKTVMGSVTSKVIREVKHPIVAVPREAHFIKVENVAFATDLAPISDESIMLFLIDTIEKFNAELMILNVHDANKNIKDTTEIEETSILKKLFKTIKYSFHYFTSENTLSGIEQFINEKDVQIIAMITRDHSFFNRLFNTSTVEKMSFLTRIPMIAIHN